MEPGLKEEEKWRIEDDVRVLSQATEILKDKKRLEAAKKLAKEKKSELEAISNMDDSFLASMGMDK